jgi:Spy/CpxP family protein refolding chaperone
MKSRTWLVALTLAALGGCETVQTTQGGAVGVERKQTMSTLVSSAQMDRSAAEAYAKVLSEARNKN